MYSAEGVRALLTDRTKLVMTVGGATALAAGIYTTRYSFYLFVLVPNSVSCQPIKLNDVEYRMHLESKKVYYVGF